MHAPAELNDHPWTQALFVRDYLERYPELKERIPGYRLLAALADVFRQMQPSRPPRQGKRLDNRWGEFGLLAALYFAPFEYGEHRPATLAEGWTRIDAEILRYVGASRSSALSPEEEARYRLVGDEPFAAPVSTLSDWHLRGLERLLETLLHRERLLSARLGKPSVLLDPHGVSEPAWKHLYTAVRSRWRALLGIALACLLLFFGVQGVGLYRAYRAFSSDVDHLQGLLSSPLEAGDMADVGERLAQAHRDAAALERRLRPWGWAGRLMGWLPLYGGDLAAAQDLVEMASALTEAGDHLYQAAAPFLSAWLSGGETPALSEVLAGLVAQEDRLLAATRAIERGLAARQRIDPARLSSKTRAKIEALDAYLPLLVDGSRALQRLPALLGADDGGPKTYLILLQNEDELRATGGFITALAVVTVERGQIISLQVDDSYAVDNLEKRYPRPPWQIWEYLSGGLWLFRDANWSPDFPTTAAWAEYLYALGRLHAVDGVIALDQYALRLLLGAVGPVEIPDWPQPVTAENFLQVVRTQRSKQEGEQDWFAQRKQFIGPLGLAILDKVQNDPDVSVRAVIQALLTALDERHILVQLDDPVLAEVLAQRGWDGALRPGEGDFLMVVDSNLGFNKADAAVEKAVKYHVDLSEPAVPRAEVVVAHHNPSRGDEPCRHAAYDTGDYQALIDRCYWDYLRVYTLADAELLDATPHAVPGEWMLSGKDIPARVDRLDNEGIVDENPPGLQAWGTWLVVPLGESLETRFEFALPADVIRRDEATGMWRYTLRVKKQPGTVANPLALQVRLPPEAALLNAAPEGGIFEDGLWILETDLRTDLDVRLEFAYP
ncbi:MAG: DUF4012 domain-containing protein [Anaerolineae bacterium]|nr:MAG: DUF4012 domain-containing protein [Anaerolineae bacterium]